MSDVSSTFASRRKRRRAIGAALSGALVGCPLCAGRCRYPTAWNTLRACPGCAGSGLVSSQRATGMFAHRCPRCEGRGGEPGRGSACPECRGFGIVVVVVAAGDSPGRTSPRRDAA